MDVLQIPLLFALGALGIALVGLGYDMLSAWWKSRRWVE